jgi:UDP-3-O-[3-hydroxymyristoyl] N-acetylglucosamine deacetylase
LLDAIGDLSLAGARSCGRLVADQPGHALNARLVRALLDTPDAWCGTEAEAGAEAHRAAPALAAAAG